MGWVEARASASEVVATLERPAEANGRSSDVWLDPSLADGALQSLAALLAGSAPGAYVPLAIEEVRLHAPLGQRATAIGRRISGGDGLLTADVTLVEPASSQAYHNLGSLLWAQERWGDAAGAFAEASRLRPGDEKLAAFAIEARRRAEK